MNDARKTALRDLGALLAHAADYTPGTEGHRIATARGHAIAAAVAKVLQEPTSDGVAVGDTFRRVTQSSFAVGRSFAVTQLDGCGAANLPGFGWVSEAELLTPAEWERVAFGIAPPAPPSHGGHELPSVDVAALLEGVRAVIVARERFTAGASLTVLEDALDALAALPGVPR